MANDCDFGRLVTHSGGYPGYGSLLILSPDSGVGVFAFANRTYAGPRQPLRATLAILNDAGVLAPRILPVSEGLAAAYAAARTVWTAGDPARAPLAMNVALDRDIARRRIEIAEMKDDVGTCAMAEPIKPISAMEGVFEWACAKGRIVGRVQRAPTPELSLQVIDFGAPGR